MIALIVAAGRAENVCAGVIPSADGGSLTDGRERLVIGVDGKMPWHIPEDLHHFRELTMGHTVLMGRRTFESIGRPLDGRRNIVLSSSEKSGVRSEGLEFMEFNAQALNKAIAQKNSSPLTPGSSITPHSLLLAPQSQERLPDACPAPPVGGETLFVIGGGTVYEQFMPLADRIYLTLVNGQWAGDTFFPAINPTRWHIISRESHEGFEYRVYDKWEE